MSTVFLSVRPRTQVRLVVAGIAMSWLSACHANRPPVASSSSDRASDAEFDCVTAVADAAEPAQSVFDEHGRSGNGNTWLALMMRAIERDARLGETIDVEAMGFGWQLEVDYLGHRSWIGFDEESGGAIFCTPDAELLQHLRSTYEHLRNDPVALGAAIREVPEDAWDD